jgi:hypothetical protein
MTRLTNTTYLNQHHQLKSEWFSESGGAFIMFSPTEQWILHSYYEFTKHLTDTDYLLIERQFPKLSRHCRRAPASHSPNSRPSRNDARRIGLRHI